MSVLFPESLLEVVAGEPVGHGSLLLVPLFGPPSGPEVSALADAIERGDTVVDEVSEAGRVQTLFVKHEGQRHLLLLDGSELIGAKQNRIVNTTILVSPGSKLSIPVSCVEAGRWSRRSGRFRSKRRGLSSTMRRNKQVRVLESLRRRGSYDACQSSVWHEVDELSTVTRVTSRTACMSDVLDATTGEVDAHVHALPPREGQTGVAAFLDGKLLGIDLLGSEECYRAHHEQLVRSYALDASIADSDSPARPEALPDPTRLLAALASAAPSCHRPPGVGTDLRMEAAGMTCSALVADEELVHLAAYPV